MEKLITVEAVAATEAGAIAAARLMGRGDRMGADRAAVEAMRNAMEEAEISGTIVIGEGERDKAPMLSRGLVRFIDTVHMWDPQQPPQVRL